MKTRRVRGDVKMQQPVIYSMYIRNHTIEGTFEAAKQDLERIKELGVDVIWLLPIHPIGQEKRKGVLGSPYAISDYRAINSEYGTLDHFREFIESAHLVGMKVIIDVVYNHTALDHHWVQTHPEYYYKNEAGEFGNKVGDWTDVIDLDYTNQDLWDEQINNLKYWLEIGVDGFRCDVPSLIPSRFWMRVRSELEQINPEVLMVAESIEPAFITTLRRDGFTALSDSELYPAFDYTYDYDIYQFQKAYLDGHFPFSMFHEKVRQQQYLLPNNAYKLRFVENHDQERIESICQSDEDQKIQWLAWIYFQKGATLLYGGVETTNRYTPTLFDREPVEWTEMNPRYVSILKALKALKVNEIVQKGYYEVDPFDREGLFVGRYTYENKVILGYFNTDCNEKWVRLPNGVRFKEARNVLTGQTLILDKALVLRDEPLIFEVIID